jgi:hypothetical protein
MHVVGLLLVAMLVGSCTVGKEFTRPMPDQLELGNVTKEDILRLYGKPERQEVSRITAPAGSGRAPLGGDAPPVLGGTITTLTYSHADVTKAVFLPGALPVTKTIVFDFFNDKLVGYNFLSNFEADSSNFDENRIESLAKGVATREDVTRLLGAPTGRAIFPATSDIANERYTYQYSEISDGQRNAKRLDIEFDQDGTLVDARFKSSNSPFVPPRPPGALLPIVIPQK